MLDRVALIIMRPEAPHFDIPFDEDPTVKLADVCTEVRRLIALQDISELHEENFEALAEMMKL